MAQTYTTQFDNQRAKNTSSQQKIDQAFARYDAGTKGFLTKTEFKCGFIFLTGMKPSGRDMDVINEFLAGGR